MLRTCAHFDFWWNHTQFICTHSIVLTRPCRTRICQEKKHCRGRGRESKKWDFWRSLDKGREGGVKQGKRKDKGGWGGGTAYMASSSWGLVQIWQVDVKTGLGQGAGDRMTQQQECGTAGTAHGQGDGPHLHILYVHLHARQLANAICVAHLKTHRKACGRPDSSSVRYVVFVCVFWGWRRHTLTEAYIMYEITNFRFFFFNLSSWWPFFILTFCQKVAKAWHFSSLALQCL